MISTKAAHVIRNYIYIGWDVVSIYLDVVTIHICVWYYTYMCIFTYIHIVCNAHLSRSVNTNTLIVSCEPFICEEGHTFLNENDWQI